MIDCCFDHGMRLDHGELERILQLARAGDASDCLTLRLGRSAVDAAGDRAGGAARATCGAQPRAGLRTGPRSKRRSAGPASCLYDFVAQLALELFT